MAVFKKRQKIVSFRVSEEEYERLRAASEVQGAHSISEYARRAACSKLQISGTVDMLDAVESLGARVDALQNEVRRVSRRVDEFK